MTAASTTKPVKTDRLGDIKLRVQAQILIVIAGIFLLLTYFLTDNYKWKYVFILLFGGTGFLLSWFFIQGLHALFGSNESKPSPDRGIQSGASLIIGCVVVMFSHSLNSIDTQNTPYRPHKILSKTKEFSLKSNSRDYKFKLHDGQGSIITTTLSEEMAKHYNLNDIIYAKSYIGLLGFEVHKIQY